MEAIRRPVDPLSTAFFRMAFAVLMLGNVIRFLVFGRVDHYFIEPEFTFTWMGFGWAQPLPAWGMYAVFIAQAAALIGMIFGWRYRQCAAAFCVLFGYQVLLEQACYQNHHYLIWLISLLLVVVPRTPAMPAWGLFILRFQIAIVYVFAAIAKVEGDWLRGEPMREWLTERSDYAVVGGLFEMEATVWLFAYGGLLIDLLIVPMMWWRRTRAVGFILVTLFHLLNVVLFKIGVFPWMMIALTTILLPASWPRKLLGRKYTPSPTPVPELSRLGLFGIIVFVIIQLLLPLRHWLYPGPVKWTEEGHCFAWRMMLRSKSGTAMFVVRSPSTGEMWNVDPRDELTDWQYERMTIKPDLVHQYAIHLAERYGAKAGGTVHVQAIVLTRVNDHPSQELVDRTVDLAAQPRQLGHDPWIGPFTPKD